MDDLPSNVDPADGGGHSQGRGNGLTAASYVTLLEVDPRVGLDLLAVLADEGIAAFVGPSQGRTGPYLDRQLPGRPMDTLSVDASQHGRAKALVDAALADLRPLDDDAAFAAIIAGYDAPAVEPARPSWPAAEAAGPAADASLPTYFVVPPVAATPPETVPLSEAVPPLGLPPIDAPLLGPRDYEPAEEPEHYVPPLPSRRPPTHPTTKWGLVTIGLGFVLLFAPWLLALEQGDGISFLAVTCILTGVGLLVSRLRTGGDDDGDDGAVV